MKTRFVAPFAGLALLAGCSGVADITAPGDTMYAPPAIYAAWWQADIACSGLTDQRKVFDGLTWYRAASNHLGPDHIVAVTYWPERVVRVGPVYVDDERIIRHEMLHAILNGAGLRHESESHDPMYFHDRCGLLP